MKRGVIVLAALAIILFVAPFISAACDLDVQLLSQDPYPAVPGEYVKLVFQMNGTSTSGCGSVFIEVVESYPFSVENDDTKISAMSGTYLSGYQSYILGGFNVRIDENAIGGENELDVKFGREGSAGFTLEKTFGIEVKNPRTDFDVSIQEYDATKKIITFGIVNIGENDIESLTLELPDQDNVEMKGQNKVIIGSLSSNDDTIANIGAVPKEGEITVKLEYNDQIDVRRSVEKKVYFSKSLLESAKNTPTPKGAYYYLFWLMILGLLAYVGYGYYKRRVKQANSKKLLLLRHR